MTALAMACGVTVIATYTEIPPPPIGFEDVCNYPFTSPSLDRAQMGRHVQNPNLEYSGKVLSAEVEGLLATLKTMSAIHGRAAEGDEEDVFLKQINEAGKDMSVQDSIAARLQLCAVKVPDDYPPKFSKVAVELLLGMERTYFFDRLETNVLYHNEKMKGDSELCLPSDLLFLTKDGQLVLMDVTGGRGEDVLEMENGIADWIEEERSAMRRREGMWSNCYSIHAVVLAPLDTSRQSTHNCTSEVTVVRGERARALLGGLAQVFWWMVRE
eukprot:gene956-1078_t